MASDPTPATSPPQSAQADATPPARATDRLLPDKTGAELVVHVDLGRCEGHGKCYGHAPELFDPFDDEGHARLVGGPIDPADCERVVQAQVAIDSCPEAALSWQAHDAADKPHERDEELD